MREATGDAPRGSGVLLPVSAVAAMALSSVSVIVNALRFRGLRL